MILIISFIAIFIGGVCIGMLIRDIQNDCINI